MFEGDSVGSLSTLWMLQKWSLNLFVAEYAFLIMLPIFVLNVVCGRIDNDNDNVSVNIRILPVLVSIMFYILL